MSLTSAIATGAWTMQATSKRRRSSSYFTTNDVGTAEVTYFQLPFVTE